MSKVIVKFLSGEEKRGIVYSFHMNQPTFHMQTENEDGTTETETVKIDSVKEILFLKKESETRSPLRTETIDQSMFASTVAFKLAIELKDGTIITGSTIKYDPNDKGFFLIPLNPGDKSERIYVNAEAVKNIDSKRLLGKILLDQKKIDIQRLNSGLMEQRKMREKKIGSILQEKKIINQKQLHESLQKQKETPNLLGEILMGAGYISNEQLDNALNIQHEHTKKKLGQILVDLKYLTPNDICIALATQLHLPWVDLSDKSISKEVATILPEEVVRKLEVIPVEKKGKDILVVATSQPQDPNILLELMKVTPLKVELVVAYEGYIESNIDYFFPKKK